MMAGGNKKNLLVEAPAVGGPLSWQHPQPGLVGGVPGPALAHNLSLILE